MVHTLWDTHHTLGVSVNRMSRRLKYIYLTSLLPLIVGSVVFFIWYYRKTNIPVNTEIELIAGFTILGFLLFAIVTLILSAIHLLKNKSNWLQVITPLIILVMTVLTIDLYSSVYNSLNEKAFVKLIVDQDHAELVRVWSKNFEQGFFDKDSKEFTISFYPVYEYDWTQASDSYQPYEIVPVNIDMRHSNGSIQTLELGTFEKGSCKTIALTELKKNANTE